MAFNEKARRYRIKSVDTSNGASKTVYYTMLSPTAGEITPNGYTIVYYTTAQLVAASNAAYLAELDKFLTKCGLTASQITTFKNTGVYTNSLCLSPITGFKFEIVEQEGASSAQSNYSRKLKWDARTDVQSYTVEYKTNAIGWTNYTAKPIRHHNTWFKMQNVPNNEFGRLWIRINGYSNGSKVATYTEELPKLDYNNGVGWQQNYAQLSMTSISAPYTDPSSGDTMPGEYELSFYTGFQIPAGYKITTTGYDYPIPKTEDVAISNNDTAQSIMNKLFEPAVVTTGSDNWGTYYAVRVQVTTTVPQFWVSLITP
jgi:hypothetical protein